MEKELNKDTMKNTTTYAENIEQALNGSGMEQ